MKKNKKANQNKNDTVELLIKTLEKEGFKPVIARNYEDYPDFGHDLDLFLDGNLKNINLIFIEVAEILKWEKLTHCDHYSNFKNEEFNIVTYHFYKFNPFQTLKVDLFGCLNLLGQPLIDRYEICKKRELEERGRFFIMKQDLENGYRIFQIASLNTKKDIFKIERYTKRVLNFHEENPGLLNLWSKNYNLGDLSMAIKALENRNYKKLKIIIINLKLKFVFNKILRNPIKTFSKILDRKKGLKIQFKTNPCGPLLLLSGDKQELFKQLDTLVSHNILPGWSEDKDLRERGWALICFKKESIKKPNFKKLLSQIIYRHEVIYSSDRNNRF